MKQYTADRVKTPDMFWLGIEKLGISRQAVARYTRLPSAVLLNQVSPTTDQFFSIWESLPLLSENPAIGFEFAKSVQTSQLPPELFAASLAKDYRDALYRISRFKSLCAPEVITIKESKGKGTIEIEWLHTKKPIPDALVDTTFCFLLSLGKVNTGLDFCVDSVQLTRGQSKSQYLQDFYGCKPQFRCKKNVVTLDSSILDTPFETYNQALSDMIIPQLEKEMADNSSTQQYSNQVKWVIEQFLASGISKITLVARELGVSVRTLQRRITDEGHTYKELLNQVRLRVAKKYLTDSTMSLNEIAALLGYEDQNSFYRAFKVMEGATPSSWRDSHDLY